VSAAASVRLLGLDFAALSLEAAAQAIERRPAGAPFRYVVTPNADHLVRLARQPALRPLYADAALCLLDSRVVAGFAHLIGLPTPPVVAGSDLTARLVARLPREERVVVIGLRAQAVRALAARRRLAPPHHYDPPMGFETDPDAFARTVDFIGAHPARLIFLAVGSPRQEMLAAALARTAGITGTALCIGASLHYLAGAARRAPVWMRRANLEWLHRLAADPNRLARRYLRDDPAIFALLLRERLRLGIGLDAPAGL